MIRMSRRKVALGATGVAMATLGLFGAGAALAATAPPSTDGTLTLAPTSGKFSINPLTFTTSGTCVNTGSTALTVTASGGGFADNTIINGKANIPIFSTDPTTGGYIVPLSDLLSNVAKNLGVTITPGTIYFDVQCSKSFGATLGDFAGSATIGSDSDSFTFNSSTPPPNLPEVPLAVGLPLAAIVIGGVTVVARRRRSSSSVVV